jgi:hypothetical protein
VVDSDGSCHESSVARRDQAAKGDEITLSGEIQTRASAEYMGEMSAAELAPFDENAVISAWRALELERAGYPAEAAAEIAGRHDIDLHRAVDLLGAGCPVELALRIVL